MLLGSFGEIGAKGDREDLLGDLLAYGEVALFVAKVAKDFLQMQGRRIVDSSGYATGV